MTEAHKPKKYWNFYNFYTMYILQAILILNFAAYCLTEGHFRTPRLLNSREITREQITNNFGGSASLLYGMAPAERTCLGVLISPDSFLSSLNHCYKFGFRIIYANSLVAPFADSYDGEKYQYPRSTYLKEVAEGSSLGISKFGPVSNTSKAVVAKLPSGELHCYPPAPGTPNCIILGYGLSSPGEYRLGYVPVMIVNFSQCALAYNLTLPGDEQGLYFCATAKTIDNKGVLCSKGDMPSIMFCNNRQSAPLDILLSLIGQYRPRKDNWELTGILYKSGGNQCTLENPAPLIFTYVANALPSTLP